MNETSRRKFLAAAGAGAAVGTIGLTGAAANAATKRDLKADEPVVAFIENPRADVVTLMFGDQELIVEDRELVTRILNATTGKVGR